MLAAAKGGGPARSSCRIGPPVSPVGHGSYGLTQLTLLGAGVLLPFAVKPKVVEPPGERLPLYDSLFTVIAPLVPLFRPFHRSVMVWPLARVRPTVQALIAAEPLSVTVTEA